MKKSEILSLTGIRGIGCLIVMFYHYKVILEPYGLTRFMDFVESWKYIVDLFFVLSGFIMCYVYEGNQADLKKIRGYFSFLWIRFVRIYPVHIFTLILFAIVQVVFFGENAFYGRYSFKYLPGTLFLLNSMGLYPKLVWTIQSWSISAELFSYILFPILFSFRSKWFKIFFISILSVLTFCMLGFYLNKELHVTYDYGYLRCFGGFTAGMATYLFWTSNKLQKRQTLLQLFSLVLFFLIYFLKLSDFLIIVPFAVLIFSLAEDKGFLGHLLSRRFCVWMGKISYSLYLVHIIPSIINRQLNFCFSELILSPTHFYFPLFNLIELMLISILAAHLITTYIELPSRRFLLTRFSRLNRTAR